MPQLPQVPTFSEGGVGGYEFTAFYALLVPGKTPREIVSRLAEATAKVVASPDYRERVISAGMESVSYSSAEMLEVAASGEFEDAKASFCDACAPRWARGSRSSSEI